MKRFFFFHFLFITQALLEKFLTLHPGKHVLLDGFPRSLDNARDWARLFGPPEACIRLVCMNPPFPTLSKRAPPPSALAIKVGCSMYQEEAVTLGVFIFAEFLVFTQRRIACFRRSLKPDYARALHGSCPGPRVRPGVFHWLRGSNRVGSAGVSKSHGSDRVGSGAFQISRVGSGHPDPI